MTNEDKSILSELPINVQLRIFHDFLYQDFFRSFNRLFRFKANRKLQNSAFDEIQRKGTLH